jgi:adenylate cyclase
VQVDEIGERVKRRSLGAHLIGPLVAFGYLSWLPPPGGRSTLSPFDLLVSAAVFVGYGAVAFPLGYLQEKRTTQAALRWLEEGRQPTEDDARATLSMPWRHALTSFVLWLGAASVFGPLNLIFDPTGYQSVRVTVGIVLAGLTTSALAFLLCERTMRPVFALALVRGRPARARRLRLGPKLVLTWALGSGVPMLAIALSPVGLGPRGQEELIAPVVGLAVLGVVVGLATSVVAARMLSDPLERLRLAVASVENEDLDVEVEVDDAGTLGYLQMGFNQMVAGLRQRRHLEDLFGRHVGVDVARRALGSGVHLEGERREVSAMFVDLVGSTRLAQAQGAEVVVRTLNAFFEVVVDVVTAEGGWVNKFEGDGALCVFGAPAEQPDHATRALRAARALRKELLALAGTNAEVDAAIGVSSGVAVAGNVGTPQRYEYTVIGDPVNEAARLTEQAKSRLGRVLVSEETIARSAGEGRRWGMVGELELRGRTMSTRAYEPGPAPGAPAPAAPPAAPLNT